MTEPPQGGAVSASEASPTVFKLIALAEIVNPVAVLLPLGTRWASHHELGGLQHFGVLFL